MGKEVGEEAASEPVKEVVTPGDASRDNGDEATRMLVPGELLLDNDEEGRTAVPEIRCGVICAWLVCLLGCCCCCGGNCCLGRIGC